MDEQDLELEELKSERSIYCARLNLCSATGFLDLVFY